MRFVYYTPYVTACVVMRCNMSGNWVLRLLFALDRRGPHNRRSLILLVMMLWSRGNINTAAVVTIVECNTLVARCSRQVIGPADWVFDTPGPLRCD